MWSEVIGERSEPPSDNLGGEFLFPRACLYFCHYYMVSYGLTTNTMTTRLLYAHIHTN